MKKIVTGPRLAAVALAIGSVAALNRTDFGRQMLATNQKDTSWLPGVG